MKGLRVRSLGLGQTLRVAIQGVPRGLCERVCTLFKVLLRVQVVKYFHVEFCCRREG